MIRMILCLCMLHGLISAQTLNLPPRSAGALSGSQFTAAIAPMSFAARENMIYNQVISGNVPNFYRTLAPVTSTAVIGGITQSVTYYVIPDYLAVGHDTDYFLCPMSPMVATKIADSIGCTLPTRKMVNDIYAQATLTLTPLTIPASGTMTTVQAMAQHNGMVWNQRHPLMSTYPPGTLTGGDKKDVVISNLIYSTANRVVIYGWHTSVGNPIQPLSNVHADTYYDYSHGIRLIQNAVMYNGNPTTVKAILQSSTLNPLLSDEGVMSQPWYPYNTVVSSLATPLSFAVINKANNTLEIKVKNDANATHYKVYTSTNGTTFSSPTTILKSNLILSSLTSNQIYYVKIAAYNATYSITSGTSEVLAAVPCNYQDSILLVNGFDRAITGNTYDFVRQHGSAVKACNKNFSSATNEAIQDALVSLGTYKAVDWILGKESTADETFSNTEQTLVSAYLKQGGFLLTSGSEIGWDLDHSGSTSDKSFYNNYLKSAYVADAPNSQASTWYTCVNMSSNSIFNFNDTVYFDNGSNGTYNVDYPDVISAMNGGTETMRYTNNSTSYSAVYFSGLFSGGSTNGKLVYMAYPFETIYNTAKRNSLMNDILVFFFPPAITTNIETFTKENIRLYPNPVQNYLYIKSENIPEHITITDMKGNTVMQLESANEKTIQVETLSPGMYMIQGYINERPFSIRFVKE
ncbi:MAG: T9SS type A sorting domain-containing protein [Bacteroidetes bacterium]|nr:T9SS type A sorting domain-containing protein [Bacteroidota bacterium]